MRTFKGRPPRLTEIFSRSPIFFVTLNTWLRRPILAHPQIHDEFRGYAQRGADLAIFVGRYVIMPDHIHLFVAMAQDSIGVWAKGLKRALNPTLMALGYQPACIPGGQLETFWQPGVFDHLLRNDESYEAKAQYMRDNPVRAGLVDNAEEWPYQGTIFDLDRCIV